MKRAIRAKTIIPLAEHSPARGLEALDAPLAELDDAVLVTGNGRVEAVEPYRFFRRRALSSFTLSDLGDVRIVPGFINAHGELELSHLGGKTPEGKGFAGWMRALLPLLGQPVNAEELGAVLDAVFLACFRGGTAHVGDVGSRSPVLVAKAAAAFAISFGAPYPVTHLLELFGFSPPETGLAPVSPFPAAEGFTPPSAAMMPPERYRDCAVSGHALYSTAPEALRAASRWCAEHGRPFSMHLAESLEEEQCLRQGAGALYDLLLPRVLPAGWEAPGLRPVAYAARLGLLGSRTLAVHTVHCDASDIALLAGSGASACLCPRSNSFIDVGTAPAKAMAEAGIPLCLGTDGLSSNHDLDMNKEMLAAADRYGLSFPAVLRMATLNGAHALGLNHLGSLCPGRAARFAVLA